MLDLNRLKRIKLSERPFGQRFIANCGLIVDYNVPRRTEIVLEGADNLPDHPVILAMNHTDRYNYWPLQYQLYREERGFTATWVKGKYYEKPLLAAFMDSMNNIPVPSRGYVISTRFRTSAGRAPTRDEYRLLRDLVDRRTAVADGALDGASEDVAAFASEPDFLERFDALFSEMIRQVVILNRRALFELNLHLLVFPQGTRSIRLTRGRTGLMQMAYHLGATVVPVGSNGCERLYPGNAPFSKGGRVVYRIGTPMPIDGPELGAHRVPEDVTPLTLEATARYGEKYEAATRIVMGKIDALLDPEYQRAEDEAEAGGVDRFL